MIERTEDSDMCSSSIEHEHGPAKQTLPPLATAEAKPHRILTIQVRRETICFSAAFVSCLNHTPFRYLPMRKVERADATADNRGINSRGRPENQGSPHLLQLLPSCSPRQVHRSRISWNQGHVRHLLTTKWNKQRVPFEINVACSEIRLPPMLEKGFRPITRHGS